MSSARSQTVLVGATLMLALYAAEVPKRRLVIAAAVISVIVVSVVIASLAGSGKTVAGHRARSPTGCSFWWRLRPW